MYIYISSLRLQLVHKRNHSFPEYSVTGASVGFNTAVCLAQGHFLFFLLFWGGEGGGSVTAEDLSWFGFFCFAEQKLSDCSGEFEHRRALLPMTMMTMMKVCELDTVLEENQREMKCERD